MQVSRPTTISLTPRQPISLASSPAAPLHPVVERCYARFAAIFPQLATDEKQMSLAIQSRGIRLLGITGPKRHGKDTVAQAIAEHCRGAIRMGMIDPVKEIVMTETGCPRSSLYGSETERTEERFEFSDRGHSISGRHLLQWLGTEAIRQRLGADAILRVWRGRVLEAPDAALILIPDVRFDNEAEEIIRNHGAVISMHREGAAPSRDHHASEQPIRPDLIMRSFTCSSAHEVRSVGRGLGSLLSQRPISTLVHAA